MFRFIGFYDYTVVLTYLSLLSSAFGITQVLAGKMTLAVICLAFSGICDAFDGRVARTKKNRTQDEKNFGIQLDSLVDVLAFGLFPALMCYRMGMNGVIGVIIAFFYCLAAVIRLAFFNMLEAKRQQEEGGSNKEYRGLPVTSISFIFPIIYCTRWLMPGAVFSIVLHLTLLLVGFLFILDFKLRKPGLKGILLLAGISVVTVGCLFAISRLLPAPPPIEEPDLAATPLIEELYEANHS